MEPKRTLVPRLVNDDHNENELNADEKAERRRAESGYPPYHRMFTPERLEPHKMVHLKEGDDDMEPVQHPEEYCNAQLASGRSYFPKSLNDAFFRGNLTIERFCAMPTMTPEKLAAWSSGTFLTNPQDLTIGKGLYMWARDMHQKSQVNFRRPFNSNDIGPGKALGLWRWLPEDRPAGCDELSDWIAVDACSALPKPSYELRYQMQMSNWLGENEILADGCPNLEWAGRMTSLAIGSVGPCARAYPKPPVKTAGRASPSGLTIAMQVRRGDSCARFGTPGDDPKHEKQRACYQLAHYMGAARQFRRRYNATTIALATDSHAVIEDAVRDYGHEFSFRFVDYNRSRNEGARSTLAEQSANENFIEIRDKLHPGTVDHGLAYRSFMADMNLLRGADMVVGTSGSVISRLFMLLVTGDRGRVPPYVMLDQPFQGPF